MALQSVDETRLTSSKMRNSDRVLVLKPMPGEKPKNVLGLVDPRLFTKGNHLHAVMDPQSCLWRLKYESGVMPPSFHQQFTTFSKLMDFTMKYFKGRSIEIVEVLD